MSETPLFEPEIGSLSLLYQGKVRDIYEVNSDLLLIVATDRVSAFDVILPTPITGKGKILTSLTEFWCKKLEHIVPNHLTGIDPAEVLNEADFKRVQGRAMVTKRLKPLPVEAIARGYLLGSAWQDYRHDGVICGVALPPDLKLAQALPQPIYTPSTKAERGEHDINIDFARTSVLLGQELAEQVRNVSLRLYTKAAEYALKRGIIIADTKFEFAATADGIVLIDEVLTPDSSRFWPAEGHTAGINPASFDKQIVRDYLETLSWDKTAAGPELPLEVVKKTVEKYKSIYKLLTA